MRHDDVRKAIHWSCLDIQRSQQPY